MLFLCPFYTRLPLNVEPGHLRTQIKHGIGLLSALLIGLVLLGLFTDFLVVRKIVLRLIMPVGICWIGLIGSTYFLFLNNRKYSAYLCLVLTLIFSLAGNSMVSWMLASNLERPYREFRFEDAPDYDIVILLGGGTLTGYHMRPQLGVSGDRVMLALHLYVAGKAKKIICTGSHIASLAPEGELPPGEQSRDILVRAGVPADSIEIMEGRNTFEEIRNLANAYDGSQLKIGIISSAWHMPRVMRLADKHHLIVEPLPANFVTSPHPISPFAPIPTSGNMQVNQMLLKEWLARFLGQ